MYQEHGQENQYDQEDLHRRIHTIHKILETYHKKFLQDNTILDHSPASVKNISPKLDHVCQVLKEFLNNFLLEETQASCKERIIEMEADDLRSLLESLCPHLVPWHPDLSPLVKYMIEQRFEYNNPFLPEQSNPLVGIPEADHPHETLAQTKLLAIPKT